MKELIFHSISPDELKQLVLEAIRETLATDTLEDMLPAKSGSSISKVEYLTRQQTADLLQISLPTLHQYTKQGIINSFRIGKKVRYKESDIKEALIERNYGRRKS